MDPNATLSELHYWLGVADESEGSEERDALWGVFNAFVTLDGWLSDGGFLPEAWADARPMTERPSRFIYTGPESDR